MHLSHGGRLGMKNDRAMARIPRRVPVFLLSLALMAAILLTCLLKPDLLEWVGGRVRYISDRIRFGSEMVAGSNKLVNASKERIQKGGALAGDYHLMAKWEMAYGTTKRAVQYLSEGIAKEPEAVCLYWELATIYLRNRNVYEAFKLYETCPPAQLHLLLGTRAVARSSWR